MPRHLEKMAECPGVIDDVAGLVAHFHTIAVEELCTGGHTIGQHRLAFHLTNGCHGEVEVAGLACVGIEQEGKFEHFAEGDAVHVEGFVAQDGGLIDGEAIWVGPCVFGQLEEFGVARFSVGPKDAFEAHDVASAYDASCEVGGGEVEVVFL